MRAIIIAGGRSHETEWQDWIRQGDWIIGANGGAARALDWGLKPNLVVGDMDSLSARHRVELEAQGCQFMVHPRAKDETDLELALTYAADQGAQEIVILGAMGGRLDHSLANVLLLALPTLEGIPIRIVDAGQEALVVRGGGEVVLNGLPGDVVSLLPLGGSVIGVTTAGLAWTLADEDLHIGHTRGVSNEMIATQARVEVARGCLLIVHGPPPED